MSRNKQTIETYIEGFNRSDHAMILSCLTDDVEWIMPGFFQLTGKPAFDAEIENPAFTGSPRVSIGRMVEEGDVVIAEGTVESQLADGSPSMPRSATSSRCRTRRSAVSSATSSLRPET